MDNILFGFIVMFAALACFALVLGRFDRFMNYVEDKHSKHDDGLKQIPFLEDRADHLESGLTYQTKRLNDQVDINSKLFSDLLKSQGRIEDLSNELSQLRAQFARANLKAKK